MSVLNPTDFTYTVARTGTQIKVTPTTATALTTAYWKGGLPANPAMWAISDGAANSNWTADSAGTIASPVVPGPNADVFIAASGAWTNNSSNPVTLNGNVSIGGGISLTFTGSGYTAINGTVTGTSGFSQLGTGTVSLYGTNLFTGGVTVAAGTVNINGTMLSDSYTLGNTTSTIDGTIVLGGSDLLPTHSLVSFKAQSYSNPVFAMGAFNQTIASLTNAGGGTIVTGTLTVTNTISAHGGNISVNLAGAAGLTKTTAGTLTLTGTNSYSGGTTISGGVLVVRGSILGAANPNASQMVALHSAWFGDAYTSALANLTNVPEPASLGLLALGALTLLRRRR